ncbi:pyridoxal phosphate-dependent aminotransferase [Pseudobacteroides cellulosolvens]|uniref:Aminotransferase n=1 Tax=Pseudobacteroides cellulosolvens ATCC 35603 = DSM 2933 TaxID=398512 RepID=A0A0L6JRK8_9FIRM|nr:pyridoxal phosphate-dependent aminotransferase [Pseudobacteroides cellulosolvens]KNY28418.1 Aspartate transaminase [Pseudobacteroides cellulosolvens ATCC 35603 = DSM 2933]
MLSQKVVSNLTNSSGIRAMFEEGERLRKIHGDKNVFDFTLGNPDMEPPLLVRDTLKKYICDDVAGIHKYMNNAGYMDVREKVAASLTKESGVELKGENIVMTCGAAGGLNIILKSILNPGEEVIIFAPYFVEYSFYIDNHGGKTVVVKPNMDTFEPDIDDLKSKISKNTKAIIINSPNNPTGVIYKEETLIKIAEVLKEKQKEFGSEIFVISDEPYNKLVYDGVKLPSLLKIFDNAIQGCSFSKSLSLPGERIGFVAASPRIKEINMLMDALIFTNRILGYVNAPSLFQRVIAETMDVTIDIGEYQKRRDLLYNHLISLGFECIKPEGAFYLFPKALIEDDTQFVKMALKYNLLIVPGKGFGCPGYFRIAYCSSLETIKGALPAFEALAKDCRG